MKRTSITKLLTTAMAVAMTASLPMGVHANTVTYPADGNYVYFYKSENNHTSAKETKAFINSIAQKQNSDGSTTVTAYDKVGNTEFILGASVPRVGKSPSAKVL